MFCHDYIFKVFIDKSLMPLINKTCKTKGKELIRELPTKKTNDIDPLAICYWFSAEIYFWFPSLHTVYVQHFTCEEVKLIPKAGHYGDLMLMQSVRLVSQMLMHSVNDLEIFVSPLCDFGELPFNLQSISVNQRQFENRLLDCWHCRVYSSGFKLLYVLYLFCFNKWMVWLIHLILILFFKLFFLFWCQSWNVPHCSSSYGHQGLLWSSPCCFIWFDYWFTNMAVHSLLPTDRLSFSFFPL